MPLTIDDIVITDTHLAHWSLAYREQRDNDIRAVLREAQSRCALLTEASEAAAYRNFPPPTTVEALISFMSYSADRDEQLAEKSREEANREHAPLYTPETADEIASLWEYAALLRKYRDQLRDLGVVPASICWDLPEEEYNEGQDYTLAFTMKGTITIWGHTQLQAEELAFTQLRALDPGDHENITSFKVERVDLL